MPASMSSVFKAVALSALAFTTPSTNGAAIHARPPILGGFTLSTEAGCPMKFDTNTEHTIVGYGQACGTCVPHKFWNGAGFLAITDANVGAYCTVTVFNTPDCSDQGIVSGPDCWTPPGGIAAYKIACPAWPPGPAYEDLVPCNNTPTGPGNTTTTPPGCSATAAP